jgi:hypothetical protein
VVSSRFRPVSTLERLRGLHDEHVAELNGLTRQILSKASTLAIEMAELQADLIRELEKERERLLARNLELEKEVERLKFENNNMSGQMLRLQFPTKGKRR